MTNSAGAVSCAATEFALSGWFEDVTNAPKDPLAPYKTCKQNAVSPPNVLLRVSSLTVESTSYIGHQATSNKIQPAPTLSPPTVSATSVSSSSFSTSVTSTAPSIAIESSQINPPTAERQSSTFTTAQPSDFQVGSDKQSQSLPGLAPTTSLLGSSRTASQTTPTTVQSSSSRVSPDRPTQSPSVLTQISPTPGPSEAASQLAQTSSGPSQANQPIQASSTSSAVQVVHVNGQSIVQGGAPITEASKVIAYSSGSLYIDNSAMPLPSPSNRLSPSSTVIHGLTVSLVPDSHSVSLSNLPIPILTIGNSVVTADSASHFSLGSQTLIAGGAPITISGTPVSLAPSGAALVIGSSTMRVSPVSRLPDLSIGSQTLAPDSRGAYVISGQTLVPGGLMTVSGTPISLMPSASGVVIGSSTSWFASLPHSTPVVTVGSSVYTANSASDFVINGQTLAPGSVITVSGTAISLMSSASGIVVGSSTSLFLAPAVTLGSQVYTVDVASKIVIGGQTLAPGSAITVSGTLISMNSKGTAVAVQASTQPASIGALIMSGFGSAGGATPTAIVSAPNQPKLPSTLSPVTVDGLTFSMDASEMVLSSTTYLIGSAATPTTVVVGNETLSLGPSGVAFPSSTIAVEPTTNASGQAFTGGASTRGRLLGTEWIAGIFMVLGAMVF